eukprot:scaffold1190_cov393-Prasinococcus_capsulatus_cf.AAC.14
MSWHWLQIQSLYRVYGVAIDSTDYEEVSLDGSFQEPTEQVRPSVSRRCRYPAFRLRVRHRNSLIPLSRTKEFELGILPPLTMDAHGNSVSVPQASSGWQIGYLGLNWKLSRFVGFSVRASPSYSYRASQSLEENLGTKPRWDQPVVQLGPSMWLGPVSMDVRYGYVPVPTETGVRWNSLRRKHAAVSLNLLELGVDKVGMFGVNHHWRHRREPAGEDSREGSHEAPREAEEDQTSGKSCSSTLYEEVQPHASTDASDTWSTSPSAPPLPTQTEFGQTGVPSPFPTAPPVPSSQQAESDSTTYQY